ncbi:MAG: hypothetical protein D6812_14455 [Deltaproteobacteria bacterium]|nr:MAG: hypothetical protein D6812_14455 [Deltaproteobacteria bacterium]
MKPPFWIRHYRLVLWIFFGGTFLAGIGAFLDAKLFLLLAGKRVEDLFFLRLAMLMVGLFGLPYLLALADARCAGAMLSVGACHKVCVSLYYHWHVLSGAVAPTFLLVAVADGLMGLIAIYYVWKDPTTFEPYRPEARVPLRERLAATWKCLRGR